VSDTFLTPDRPGEEFNGRDGVDSPNRAWSGSMSYARSLWLIVVLLVVALLAGGAWWLLRGSDASLEPSAEQRAQQERHVAAALQASAGSTQESALAAAEHIVAGAPRQQIDDAAPAVIGCIVDTAGHGVSGAQVLCTPSLSFDGGEDNFADPQAWAKRTRDLRQQRTETRTDAEGRFRLPLPRAGTQLGLRVAARGLAIHNQAMRRPEQGNYDAGTLTLKPAAVVSGRVVDTAGKPVAKATVRSDRAEGGGFDYRFDSDNPLEDWNDLTSDGGSVVTDQEGRFALLHVPSGNIHLAARHADHPTTRLRDQKVLPGGELSDLVLTLEPGATIRGKVSGIPAGTKGLRVVCSRKDGQPEHGAVRISMGGLEEDFGTAERGASPNAEGSFVLRGLALASIYRVHLTQQVRGFGGTGICSQRLEVRSGAEGVELRYEPGVSVTFRVVDARTQAGIERLWINDRLKDDTGLLDFAFAGEVNAREYPGGQVTLANLRPKKKQTLSLAIDAIGFAKFTRDGIELPLQGALDLGTVQLPPLPVLHVTVQAARDGQPVVGAQVRVASKRKPGSAPANPFDELIGTRGGGPTAAKTDAKGRATLNSLPGAEVEITVTSAEFAPYASAPFTLPERDDGTHDVRLTRGGNVVVEVVDADGKPAPKANVAHRPPAGPGTSAATDAHGRATFARLAGGEHRFRIARSGDDRGIALYGAAVRETIALGANTATTGKDDWQRVQVVEDGEATVRLTLPLTAKLKGSVRENGKPLAGAQVVLDTTGDREAALRLLMESGGNPPRAQTDEHGRYQLEGVRLGEQRLRVTHKDRAMPAFADVAVREGDNVFDVELDVTVVRGVVRGPDGKPIAGVDVRAGASNASVTSSRTLNPMPDVMPTFGGRRYGDSSAKTDAQGRYELRGVQSGRAVTVTASAKGFAATSAKPVEPAAGATIDGVDIELRGAGIIVVRTATETTFAMANASFLGDDKTVRPAVGVVSKGEAKLEGLFPGRWRVHLTVPGQAPGQAQTREVEVRAGAVTEVNF
jgi:protocatechuate 3,4-dioxygenase beta subunit